MLTTCWHASPRGNQVDGWPWALHFQRFGTLKGRVMIEGIHSQHQSSSSSIFKNRYFSFLSYLCSAVCCILLFSLFVFDSLSCVFLLLSLSLVLTGSFFLSSFCCFLAFNSFSSHLLFPSIFHVPFYYHLIDYVCQCWEPFGMLMTHWYSASALRFPQRRLGWRFTASSLSTWQLITFQLVSSERSSYYRGLALKRLTTIEL